MVEDFYCDEVLSEHTPVRKVVETDKVLAFHHTRPHWTVHIVVIPKQHIDSLLALDQADDDLLSEMFAVIRQVAAQVVAEQGGCRVVTNLGAYQDSKHLHWHVGAGEPLRNR
jgi:histidine triad (HIT) family protein